MRTLYQSISWAISGLKEVKGLSFKIMVIVGISAITALFILKVPTSSKLIIYL